jgi:hypothetical protein
MPVERLLYLCVVEDFTRWVRWSFSVLNVCTSPYARFFLDARVWNVKYPDLLSIVDGGGFVGFIQRI